MNKEAGVSDKWFVIVNPQGGSGKVRKKWPNLKAKLLAAGIQLEDRFTSGKMDAVRLVQDAVLSGFRRIIAVGGDGTNHEVVNGILLQQVVKSSEITYALLPVGTGNDWIRTHQIPKDPDAWIGMLKAGHTRLQDVGLVHYQAFDESRQKRYFVNIAGMAYDAFVVHEMEQRGSWVRNSLVYLVYVFALLFKYKLKEARVIADGQESRDKFYTINVGLCCYSGGGMQFVPHAVPDDGQLAFTTAGNLNVLQVMRATPWFYNGRVGEYPKVETGFARNIRVEAISDKASAQTQLEADGEHLGTTPVEFSIVPAALCYISPKG
ncbi:MAG: diacylglycerol kinase family lipid kinase [Bacteroidetes bacterium]|nr:diacylglycerol kinase family lipid kinase [Bacteroidota bacterium]